MGLLLTIVLCLLCGAAAGVALYLVGRNRERQQVLLLEARLYRLEKSSGREMRERLRIMRQRTGVVYVNGLGFSASREVAQPFNAGLEHASRGHWDRTLHEWTEARKQASGSEAVALDFLSGCCHLMSGRPEQARTALSSALAHARRLRDRPGMASCCFVLGRLEREAKRYAASQTHYAASGRLWGALGDPELEARALTEVAEVVAELGKWPYSLELHRRALRLLERSGDRVGAAARYGAIGAILAQQGELDKARAAHEDGLHLARQAGDRLAEADHLSAVGEIHLVQGSPKRALDVFERALRLYRDAQRLAGQARVLLRLALVHRRLGETDVALEYCEHALRLGRKMGDRQLIARSLEGVAEGIAAHGAHERAQALFEEAVTLDRETGDAAGLGRHLAGLGRALLEQHEAAKAEEVLREAVEAGRRAADSEAELNAAVELGRAFRKQGRTAEALALLDRYRTVKAADQDAAARLHVETGLGCLGQNDPARAVAELQQAAELRRAAGGREHGLTLVNLGRALSANNERDAGMRSIEDGLRRLHESGTRSDESWALRLLADANRQQGSPNIARQNLSRALELAREGQDALAEAECLVGLGRLAAAEQDYGRARSHLELALRACTRAGAETRAREVTDELRRLPHTGVGVQFLDEGSSG